MPKYKLSDATKELAFQMEEKETLVSELIIANKELIFQKEEKEQLLAELITIKKELAFQNNEKEKRPAELIIANYARSLIEASLDPLVTISASGKILDVNEASIKVTGVEREKLIDTDFSNYFTEPEKAREGYRQVFEKGFVADYPLTIKHKNGNLTDVLYNASVYKDDKGNVLGVFAAARDVTDAKEAQEKLQASEERIRLATTASGVGVWEWNVITNKIRWDAQMFRIYGVAPTADGLIEYSTWSNAVAPEDLADQEKILQDTVKNIATSNRSFKIYRANDGMQCFIEAIETVRINAVGQAQWVVGTNLDVTEQKQASRYARSLIEASLDPLVTISAAGKILDVNEASIKVTGIAREKLIGTDFSNYFTEPQKAQEGYRQVFEKGFVADYPLTIKHKNGNLTDVLYNASVYKDDKGNVLGVFAAARDVTQQKQASRYARSLIEASLDPLVTISATGKILDVNEASIKVTGVEREKLIDTDFSDYFTEPEKAQEGYRQVFEKGFVADYPLTIKHKNGNLTDVLYNASVYKDDKGNVLGVFAAARDITSQKQASQYARSLIEASLDPLVTISADGKITDVNEASIKVTGVEREKLIGTDFSNYFTEPQKAQEGYRQVFEKGFVADYPLTIKHKNGNLTDVLYNASVYKDDKGNVLGVFAAARDVTQQKQASQYARSLIEASLDPLVTISAAGKILDVNEASIKVTGVEREKLIGTDFSNYFTEPQKAQEGYRQVFEKGFVADYPLTIKHKNGNLTDVLYNASVYKDDKGNVLGVFAAARDVTSQKQASQYARSLIEASLDPLVTISADGKILDVNEASIKVTGVEREKLIDTDFSNYFTEPEKAQEGYRQVFEKGFVADYPLTIKHKNGNLTDVLYNASVYKDDKGNVLGVFAAARDVTERKMFEKEMIDAKVSAENATKSKQQFLSNMSHEIRTPLNSILGFTNVLLKTELGVEQKEFVQAIKTSGKSLTLLINDILDLAKVDSGKMTFEKQPFEILKSITSILHSFDLKIKENNLELIKEYDTKIPSMLCGDPLKLNQIILNLTSNAVKFTHQGKIKLSVKLLSETEENMTLEFTITDTGIGIADNKLNSIFNIFEQAEISTSTFYGGTGLGLAIVKQLVEGQGGSVGVKSKLGEGSIFSFILPFGKTNLKLEEEIVLLKPISAIKSLRVLVAEDVALNQLLIKIILSDFGFEHDIVGNGKSAIEKMHTNTYDIILMDLHMPEMNGFEATEYIRKTLKSQIPILALTADVTTADVSKCKEFGMDDYLSKPIDENSLYNKIVELVKKKNNY